MYRTRRKSHQKGKKGADFVYFRKDNLKEKPNDLKEYALWLLEEANDCNVQVEVADWLNLLFVSSFWGGWCFVGVNIW